MAFEPMSLWPEVLATLQQTILSGWLSQASVVILSVIMLNVIHFKMLGVILLNVVNVKLPRVVMLNVIMRSFVMLIVIYAECHYAERRGATLSSCRLRALYC